MLTFKNVLSIVLTLLCFSSTLMEKDCSKGDGPAEPSKSIKPSLSFSYQPPILPLTISVNTSGEISFRLSHNCVTPIGTFGVGGGISEVRNPNITYFIVRLKEKEHVYGIGGRGRLRLVSVGKIVIEISNLQGFKNAFLIDIQNQSGTFTIEYVPDPDSKELARIHWGPFDEIVLSNSGDFIIDHIGEDTIIPFIDLDKLFLVEQKKGYFCFIYFYNIKGKKKYGQFLLSPEMAIEARWFCYCLKTISSEKIGEIKVVEKVGNENQGLIFNDGSVLLYFTFIPASGIDRIYQSTSKPKVAVVKLNKKFEMPVDELKIMFSDTESTIRFINLAENQRKL